jgi:hypothetical protein
VVNQKQKDYIPFVPFRMQINSVELEPTPAGRERSGPVLADAEDSYEGSLTDDGKRLTRSTRRAAMREQMVEIVTDEPGLSWRRLRDAVPGKNTELMLVRDELIESGVLEYDEAVGGYLLGTVPLEMSPEAELPPLLGEREDDDG